MRKVLIVSGSLRVGGLEKVALNCAKYADRELFAFDFLVYGQDKGEYEAEALKLGCQVIRIGNPSHKYIHFYDSLCKVMKEYGPYDIVHSHTFFNSGFVMRAAYKCGIPIRISHAHSVKRTEKRRIDKDIYCLLMRHWIKKYSTQYCACSEEAGEYLFSKNIFKEVGIVVPNIVIMDRFAYSSTVRKQMREVFQIENEQIVLGQVGHLTSAKNQCFLMELFAAYLKEETNAILLLVGDGELRQQLWNKAEELGINESVRFTGTRDDIGACLSAMDVFVCTSTNEGFGIVLLEAQANGLPVVIEKSVLVEEIRKLGNCYETCGFGNIYEWIEKIREALGRSRDMDLVERLRLSEYTEQGFRNVLNELYEAQENR